MEGKVALLKACRSKNKNLRSLEDLAMQTVSDTVLTHFAKIPEPFEGLPGELLERLATFLQSKHKLHLTEVSPLLATERTRFFKLHHGEQGFDPEVKWDCEKLATLYSLIAIKCQSTLTNLELNPASLNLRYGWQGPQIDRQSLLGLLAKLGNLCELTLGGACEVKDDTLGVIGATCENLRSLRLVDCNISVCGIRLLGEEGPGPHGRCKNLTLLHMNEVDVETSVAALTYLPKLKELHCWSSHKCILFQALTLFVKRNGMKELQLENLCIFVTHLDRSFQSYDGSVIPLVLTTSNGSFLSFILPNDASVRPLVLPNSDGSFLSHILPNVKYLELCSRIPDTSNLSYVTEVSKLELYCVTWSLPDQMSFIRLHSASLTSLTLHVVDICDISFIGYHCINLSSFHLIQTNKTDTIVKCQYDLEKHCFSKLKTLILQWYQYGINFRQQIIFSQASAVKTALMSPVLEEFNLSGIPGMTLILQEVINEALAFGEVLSNLKFIHIDFKMPDDTLQKLLILAPGLNKLYTRKKEGKRLKVFLKTCKLAEDFDIKYNSDESSDSDESSESDVDMDDDDDHVFNYMLNDGDGIDEEGDGDRDDNTENEMEENGDNNEKNGHMVVDKSKDK